MNYICYSSYFRSELGGKDTKLFHFRQDITRIIWSNYDIWFAFPTFGGRNDPFAGRKVLPNRAQFRFDPIRLFRIFEIDWWH